MFSLFNTTSYKKGAALAVACTAFWKILSFFNGILIALYFGAGTGTDIYFYLMMLMGFGVAFMQRLNSTVLIPEAMFLQKEDPAQSRRFLTAGFYFYVLLGLGLCWAGLMFPVGALEWTSRFSPSLLQEQRLLLGLAFVLFAAQLLTYYLTAVAEMHKFFGTALLGPLNALGPLVCLLLWGHSVGIISMVYGFLAAYVLQIGLLVGLLVKKLHWDFIPRPVSLPVRAQKNMLTGQTLAVIDIVNNLLPLYLISGMGAGLVSALNYCRQITDSPTEIITNRVVNVSKIEMTENAARGQVNVFNKNFLSTNHLLLFVLTPLAVFISYFAADVVALFFKRGQFGPLAAAHTTAFLRPMVFMLVLLVPAYLQNNAVAAWCKIKENFPYALASALAFTAAAAWVLPRCGAHAYPYLLLGGLVLGFAVNALFFRRYFPFVNYFRAFWELLRLLAINVIALVPAAAVRIFLGEKDPFLNLLFSGSVFVTVLLVISYKSRDLQLFLKTTEISRLIQKLF